MNQTIDYKRLLAKGADWFSSNTASGHFWYQRLTAIALAPLTFWLLMLLNSAMYQPYAQTLKWLDNPFNVLAILVWAAAAIYHAALGVQVVIEDYVSTLSIRHLAIRATNLVFLALAGAVLLAIFIILLVR